ncbi:MAG: GGDEF domain-containing protein [Patulibacter sp.]
MSRHDLARNRYVWLSTGWMFAFLGLCTLGCALLPLGYHRNQMLLFGALLLLIALAHLRSEPPELDSPANHLGLFALWGAVGLGLFAWTPAGMPVLANAMFIGALVASRLIDREQIVAHLLGASAVMVAPAALGFTDQRTTFAIAAALPTMWILCACVAIVLEAAEAQGNELEALVRRDPLTGVGNRRLLNEQLAEDLDRQARLQRPLSVVALDLNGFKAINDEIGHSSGDELLRQVAAALVRVVRDHGTVVRQGGDEFCIILPNYGPSDTTHLIDAIRAELRTVQLPAGRISTGFGVASYPRDAVHAGVLLHVADERLREQKAGDLTIIGEPIPMPGPVTEDATFGRPELYRRA